MAGVMTIERNEATAPAATGRGLKYLEQVAEVEGRRGLPPVHLWHPENCGELDIRIAADGQWFYMGTPIERQRLVRLFSTVLRHDDDGRHYLVTPVEKIGIAVEDAPFVAVEMAVDGKGRDQRISLRTNVDDVVSVDEDHPLRFVEQEETGGLKPYVLVRGRLEALLSRAIFYDLVELGATEAQKGVEMFGVWSAGTFFPMAPAAEIWAED
ncbi:MAG: DUF1285 domain-containing protein [Rhodobiaceae bacterium]|nr:DUF1285 domain-containing protein [Rhodobiaceae bacterium]MCC0056384.1 DUF1285 domain-containing protein [Rhodobiaceae bacterium]